MLPDGFVPLPGLSGYGIHPDGRVVSLKKQRPAILAERHSDSGNETYTTVRIGHTDLRVRDLVTAFFGGSVRMSERLDPVLSDRRRLRAERNDWEWSDGE